MKKATFIIICAALAVVSFVSLATAEPEPQIIYVLDHNTGDLYSGTPDAQGIVHIDTTGYVD